MIPSEVTHRLTNFQNQIWQSVTLTASDAAGTALTFSSPLTVPISTSDLFAELSSPKLIIQFALASLPENPMMILIPQETFGDLARMQHEDPIVEVDENLLSDVRGICEAIVQGLCLAIGNIRNDGAAASGLSIRFQLASLPLNIQRSEEVLQTKIAISAEELSGNATLLMDVETALHILGMSSAIDDSEPAEVAPAFNAKERSSQLELKSEDSSRIDMLLDIPLDICVELGRVKMLVKDVLELGAGSIIEIEKAAGDPVDVLVNRRVVARGEVVVIEDNFGVRITEILNPQERLQRLSEAA